MTKNDWIQKAIKENLKKCFNCKKWITYKVVQELDKRIKICPNCNLQREFKSISVEFKTIDGQMYRKEEGKYYLVDFIKVKGGIKLSRVQS